MNLNGSMRRGFMKSLAAGMTGVGGGLAGCISRYPTYEFSEFGEAGGDVFNTEGYVAGPSDETVYYSRRHPERGVELVEPQAVHEFYESEETVGTQDPVLVFEDQPVIGTGAYRLRARRVKYYLDEDREESGWGIWAEQVRSID